MTKRHNDAVRVLTLEHATLLTDLIERSKQDREKYIRIERSDAIELRDDILELLE